jgi:hypothetical protein
MIPVELLIPIVNFVWLRSERRREELPAQPSTVS